jgi:hypothetical protein
MSTEYIADDTEVVPTATEGPPQAETPRLGDGASVVVLAWTLNYA